ncbi:lytic polysaccharide monooxygenase [Paenibacillus sp. GbtcB18]|uniref:lytic polysaccharide monooxygenase n=1 Tax=Paenibacillus sp. GbtcB18 TaxID=2824763 RepID=UPI001C307190|nr:lytic polysaccharide monooxygenase [Paenibacillus sp. GbtcB18]
MTIRLPYQGMIKMLAAGAIMLMLSIAMLLLMENKASAHGYVSNPSSRAALCASGVNKNCGLIIYEPYSLEALKGFPAAGPADGKIASANGLFAPLDEQSSTRWTKVNLSPGPTTFNWTLKVPHATSAWKYYITKQDWNPNAPLSRASFDLTPFCNVPYKGQPSGSYSDTCNVPSRTGYQVILAVWEIADTANAFYNVIDVNFGGSPGTPDTTAPTAPAGLTASNVAATSATVSWTASSDNVGVAGYRIFNGSTQIGTTSGALSYNLTGLTANTAYAITVKAVDAAGNVSAASNTVNFTTIAGTTYPAWNASTAYTGGSKVTYNGVNYEAKWWTQGETPGSNSSVWKVIP